MRQQSCADKGIPKQSLGTRKDMILEGGAKELAEKRGVSAVWITLSHTENHAMAMIVIEAKDATEPPSS